MRLSALRALETFAKVCDQTVVDTIARSSSAILQSSDQYQQQATVLLFSTICEYSHKEYVQNMFRNGFDHLFGLLQSQSKVVVRNSLIGFLRLAESVPEVFLTYNNISTIVDKIMSFVTILDQ
jgi:hypothetical protein